MCVPYVCRGKRGRRSAAGDQCSSIIHNGLWHREFPFLRFPPLPGISPSAQGPQMAQNASKSRFPARGGPGRRALERKKITPLPCGYGGTILVRGEHQMSRRCLMPSAVNTDAPPPLRLLIHTLLPFWPGHGLYSTRDGTRAVPFGRLGCQCCPPACVPRALQSGHADGDSPWAGLGLGSPS